MTPQEDEAESEIVVGYADGRTLAFKASSLHPFDVFEGHLHVLNNKGYSIAVFAPGMWTAVVSQKNTIKADDDQARD